MDETAYLWRVASRAEDGGRRRRGRRTESVRVLTTPGTVLPEVAGRWFGRKCVVGGAVHVSTESIVSLPRALSDNSLSNSLQTASSVPPKIKYEDARLVRVYFESNIRAKIKISAIE